MKVTVSESPGVANAGETAAVIDRIGRRSVVSDCAEAGPYAFAMTHAAFGGFVLLRDKFDAAESLKLMDENDIRQAYYVPTHFVRFLKLDDATKRSPGMR